jgi:hypothetical protein
VVYLNWGWKAMTQKAFPFFLFNVGSISNSADLASISEMEIAVDWKVYAQTPCHAKVSIAYLNRIERRSHTFPSDS